MRVFRPLLVLAAAGVAVPYPAMAAGDAAVGSRLFLQCRACHKVTADGKHTVGPNLFGVVGAKAASKKGYSFSPALTKANIVWTPEVLDAFLKKPTATVPGTKMVFVGMPAAKARADMIAYLATLKAPKK